MQTAIKDIETEDQSRADKIRNQLNELSKKGGALERALARQKAKESEHDSEQEAETDTIEKT